MTTRIRGLAAVTTTVAGTVLALTLSACGSSSTLPDLDAGGDAKPATGAVVKGHGYTFHLPSGWKEQSPKKLGQPSADTIALSPTAHNGFSPNVNVVVKPKMVKGTLTSSDYTKGEKALVSTLKGVGSSNLHVQPRLDLADETALHITGNAKQGSLQYQTDQYVTFHKGTQYIVTFSFPIDYQESQSTKVTEPSMASWSWS